MIISGFDKLTLLDYPKKVAAIIFTGGCNYRCPYCHNGEVVLKPSESVMRKQDILDYLKKRRGLLDGVVITGGEPLIHGDIDELISEIKNLGYSIKLDTNGTFPEKLNELIKSGSIDYVAMDVKAGREHYRLATGLLSKSEEDFNIIYENILKSADIIKNSNISHEFRTTYCQGIHDDSDIDDIIKVVKGAKNYYLQNYKESEMIINKLTSGEVKLAPFDADTLSEYAKRISPYVENISIR